VVVWIDDRTPLPRPGSVPEKVPGLVAAGGSLTVGRLDEAYRLGLFPWFGPRQPVLWWSPDPRMLLPVAEFRLQRSLRKTLRQFLATPGCEIVFDRDFRAVIQACADAPREGQDGTWIVADMVEAYTAWHRAGRVHSVETWVCGMLVGGLYFVSIGGMVFGESMFARCTDASKFALAALVAACRARGVPQIDCQQHTGHLASLGAREVPRGEFERRLSLALGASDIADWTYDPAHWALLDARLEGA
jgi:leucyl/phenylalanyl-tRNA---protein transferase